MRATVGMERLTIPRQLLEGLTEVDIRRENGVLIVAPVPSPDPILELGCDPLNIDIEDASVQHDRCLSQP